MTQNKLSPLILVFCQLPHLQKILVVVSCVKNFSEPFFCVLEHSIVLTGITCLIIKYLTAAARLTKARHWLHLNLQFPWIWHLDHCPELTLPNMPFIPFQASVHSTVMSGLDYRELILTQQNQMITVHCALLPRHILHTKLLNCVMKLAFFITRRNTHFMMFICKAQLSHLPHSSLILIIQLWCTIQLWIMIT